MEIHEVIHNGGFECFDGQVLRIDAKSTLPVVITDPRKLTVEVASGADGKLVLLHASACEASVSIELADDASLSVTQLFTAEAFVSMSVAQAARSRYTLVVAELTSANAAYRVALDGCNAECSLSGVFIASGTEHCEASVRIEHNSPDCHSNSFIKGVAGGEAMGEFRGLVYVAPDAQRTDAQQQSRNILLSEQAYIRTQPQLEIYADDVKCSHGATVGRMDSDAVYYMRQRGLSLTQARALQVEGFVGDIVRRCDIEPLREALIDAVSEKLHTM